MFGEFYPKLETGEMGLVGPFPEQQDDPACLLGSNDLAVWGAMMPELGNRALRATSRGGLTSMSRGPGRVPQPMLDLCSVQPNTSSNSSSCEVMEVSGRGREAQCRSEANETLTLYLPSDLAGHDAIDVHMFVPCIKHLHQASA